ncbi:hypothetical protein NBRC116583_05090 [Arenicella sp. 4NH20-0111]|uniref:DUF465 domain-containing protein n=1 Tax=Arenicella sp. 4NH20-0111 TaxID=3127648 RepID=UPI0031084D42
MTISTTEKNSLIQELAQLKQDHRELDIAIEDLAKTLQTNQLEVSRLKRRKLKLKDAIAKLESKMIPDLHA